MRVDVGYYVLGGGAARCRRHARIAGRRDVGRPLRVPRRARAHGRPAERVRRSRSRASGGRRSRSAAPSTSRCRPSSGAARGQRVPRRGSARFTLSRSPRPRARPRSPRGCRAGPACVDCQGAGEKLACARSPTSDGGKSPRGRPAAPGVAGAVDAGRRHPGSPRGPSDGRLTPYEFTAGFPRLGRRPRGRAPASRAPAPSPRSRPSWLE